MQFWKEWILICFVIEVGVVKLMKNDQFLVFLVG